MSVQNLYPFFRPTAYNFCKETHVLFASHPPRSYTVVVCKSGAATKGFVTVGTATF
jgi:hypothetical protein